VNFALSVQIHRRSILKKMIHLPGLISDLALILGAAAVIILIFKALRQPIVLGYIIAGLLVGPHVKLFPTVIDIANIRTWADIGVIFLLFGLGLEFSFKKLVRVGTVSGITALFGVGLTMLLGYTTGRLLGWTSMDCLFLGGILGIASTTIIIRAFDELGVKSQKFTGIVMGVLIVEDLVAVVLMVILSTVAVSQSFHGGAMIASVLKLVFFLVLWFVSGIFFLPSFFKWARNLMNEETLLIVSLALCFLMVILATNAGFSPAFGAFIMGSILAETPKVEKIDHLVKSVKNLFGAIFFVSVGMLLDPHMLVQYALPITIATLVLLIGKPLFVTLGALVAGQPLRIAVQSGMSLSQIGEFSFIIATLGVTLNVTSDFLYPVAVAVSVLTTFTTSYMIRFSESASAGLNRILPAKWTAALETYSAGALNVTEASDWRKLIRSNVIHITVFSVVIITIILLSTRYLMPLLSTYHWNRFIAVAFILILLAPFLWALAFKRTNREAYAKLWIRPLQRGPLVMLSLARIALAIFYIGFLFGRIFSPLTALSGVVITLVIIVLFRSRIQQFYGKIEQRFLTNLHQNEAVGTQSVLTPWDTHLASFELSSFSPLVGKTLMELQLREAFGVNVAAIERGEMIINVPERSERLYPNDKLSVIGTDEQLRQFKRYLDIPESMASSARKAVSLDHFTIHEGSHLIGQSIRASKIREQTKGLVVGVERQGDRILNPESDLVFEQEDKLWIVGDERRIQVMAKEQLWLEKKHKDSRK
jgi:CPA2 family monovalent cation:H+ antiporter-2